MKDREAGRNGAAGSLHRVAVTGVGLVCGLGREREDIWRRLLNGESGIRKITSFNTDQFATRIAGTVEDFNPEDYIDKKDIKKMGRFIQFALAATQQAMEQSGLKISAENAERVGVNVGSGIGGFEVIEREYSTLLQRGPSRISPFFRISPTRATPRKRNTTVASTSIRPVGT